MPGNGTSWRPDVVLAAVAAGGSVLWLGAGLFVLPGVGGEMLDHLDWYAGPIPITTKLALTPGLVWISAAVAMVTAVLGLLLRRSGRVRPARAVLASAAVLSPLGAAVAFHGLHTGAAILAVPVAGATHCPCEGIFELVGDGECACDAEGRVIEQHVVDLGAGYAPTIRVRYRYDAQGRLLEEELDRGMDGVVEQVCRFSPPCPLDRAEDCARSCEPDRGTDHRP